MKLPPSEIEVSRRWDDKSHCWEFRARIVLQSLFTVPGAYVKAASENFAMIDPVLDAERRVLSGIAEEARRLAAATEEALEP